MTYRFPLQDAIFHWLSMQVVVEKKPHDEAAQETCRELREVLAEIYNIGSIRYEKKEGNYIVYYERNGERGEKHFMSEHVESLWQSINDQTLYVPGREEK